MECMTLAIQALPPAAAPDLEELRLRYPPVGCWGPTCVAQSPTVLPERILTMPPTLTSSWLLSRTFSKKTA